LANRADNFNRADTSGNNIGTPSDGGSAWINTLSGSWDIGSNQAKETSGTGQVICVLEASTALATVQATATNLGSNAGLVLCVSDDNNYIVGVFAPGFSMAVYKRVAGSFTQLGSTYGGSISNGDVFALERDASDNIAFKQNGVSRVTATDSFNNTATKHGLRANSDTSVRFDDFSITDNSGGGGGGTVIPVFMNQYRQRWS